MTDIIVVIRSVVVVLTIALLKLLVMGSKVAVKYSYCVELNPDRVLLLMAAGASINSDELVVVVVVDVDTELDMVLVIGSSFKVIEPASFNEV